MHTTHYAYSFQGEFIIGIPWQNFRMWFKYGLKAQKLLAQGNTLGIIAVSKAPCKGKSLIKYPFFKRFCP